MITLTNVFLSGMGRHLLLEKRIPIGKLEIMRLLFLKGKQHLAQEFSLFVQAK